jgi:hypothetical protein
MSRAWEELAGNAAKQKQDPKTHGNTNLGNGEIHATSAKPQTQNTHKAKPWQWENTRNEDRSTTAPFAFAVQVGNMTKRLPQLQRAYVRGAYHKMALPLLVLVGFRVFAMCILFGRSFLQVPSFLCVSTVSVPV